MANTSLSKRDYEWMDYYESFDYFLPEVVRDGCHPRIMEHEKQTKKAIVLVHGLSDSPYFLTEIGKFFHERLGYNVYLPLLYCHGLKDPQGMNDVKLAEWKSNVNFAIDYAAAKADEISVGGLSTGGAISFYMAVNNSKVNGTIYLFSAALDLYGGIGGLVGELKERILRSFVADVLDKMSNDKTLVGKNPYRYTHIDMSGAQELSLLIKENDAILNKFSSQNLFSTRVFVAHSESDKSANITGITDLQKICDPDKFSFFRIPESANVSNASLVLKNPVFALDSTEKDEALEKANLLFQEMLEAIVAFR